MAVSKMNPEVKARWVAALRSGKYRQTRMALKDRTGYCCLGVLCDLYAKELGMAWKATQLSERADQPRNFLADTALPSAQVLIWSGLDTDRDVLIGGERESLYDHNDHGRTFAEIADAVEAQL